MKQKDAQWGCGLIETLKILPQYCKNRRKNFKNVL